MKAEIQLVKEAAITCSYCQSNAHSRIVQPLCKLQRAEDGKPRAVHHRPKQMIFQRSHVFLSQAYMGLLGSHCFSADPRVTDAPGLWGHSRIRPSHVDGVHPPPTKHISSGSAKCLSIMQTLFSFSIQKVTLRL